MKRTSFTRQNFDQNGIIRSILSIFLPWLETWQDRTTSIAQTTNCSTASTSISSSRRFTSDRDSKQGHSETDVRSDVRLEATKNWITGGRAEGGREERGDFLWLIWLQHSGHRFEFKSLSECGSVALLQWLGDSVVEQIPSSLFILCTKWEINNSEYRQSIKMISSYSIDCRETNVIVGTKSIIEHFIFLCNLLKAWKRKMLFLSLLTFIENKDCCPGIDSVPGVSDGTKK